MLEDLLIRKEKDEEMKVLEILELVKKQLFMTEKGLVSIETLADKAIAEVEAMQERIKELEAENEDLLQQVNDYEQFSEIISEPKETHE